MNDNHIADERKLFEEWAKTCEGNCADYDLKRERSGLEYDNCEVERDWQVWQASRNAAPIAERADADTAWAKPDRWADKTIACQECRLTYGESHMLSDIASGRVAVAATPAISVADAAGKFNAEQENEQYETFCKTEGVEICQEGWRAWQARALIAAGASERADAEKDATLTDEYLDKLFFWMVKHHRDGHLRGFKEFARAILAANKEKP